MATATPEILLKYAFKNYAVNSNCLAALALILGSIALVLASVS